MKNGEKATSRKKKTVTPKEKLIAATKKHGIKRNNDAIKNSTDLKEIFEGVSLEDVRKKAWGIN